MQIILAYRQMDLSLEPTIPAVGPWLPVFLGDGAPGLEDCTQEGPERGSLSAWTGCQRAVSPGPVVFSLLRLASIGLADLA